MPALLLALALFAQDAPPAAEAATPAPAPAAEAPAVAPEDRLPSGAPSEDYPFVAWCYGALRGYLDLHDQVMPEVKRIESTYRPPNRSLAEDMKVYADMQKYGQAKLKDFQAALTAAEKASVRPINAQGAAAVRQGRSVWLAGPDVTKARMAQEWMSWALPARCETVSAKLLQSATLMGASLKANTPVADPAPAPAEPAPN